MYLAAPAEKDGEGAGTAPAAGPGAHRSRFVRLYAAWEGVGGIKVTFPGDDRVASAGSHDSTTAHLLFPVWCPVVSPRFRCAEGQLVGGEGLAENGECFHFPGPRSSLSERNA